MTDKDIHALQELSNAITDLYGIGGHMEYNLRREKMVEPSDYDFYAKVLRGEFRGRMVYVDGTLDDGDGDGHPCYFVTDKNEVDVLGGYCLLASEDLVAIPSGE